MRIASTHKTTWKRRRPRYQLVTMRRPDGVRFHPHFTGRWGGPRWVLTPRWARRWTWWRPRSLLTSVWWKAHRLPPLAPDRERGTEET